MGEDDTRMGRTARPPWTTYHSSPLTQMGSRMDTNRLEATLAPVVPGYSHFSPFPPFFYTPLTLNSLRSGRQRGTPNAQCSRQAQICNTERQQSPAEPPANQPQRLQADLPADRAPRTSRMSGAPCGRSRQPSAPPGSQEHGAEGGAPTTISHGSTENQAALAMQPQGER
ncbi:hypothetical protein NDU88_005682 [Pleurodeles waltl]|uniref:Uncharacterized protein n=1 Tax=Pleurodeles waltl TaxID=8319 RepID=A0AAV7VNL6_PLEWA|nr:hypothetical protein NDU88_005682 [Pleurodeles waltl]